MRRDASDSGRKEKERKGEERACCTFPLSWFCATNSALVGPPFVVGKRGPPSVQLLVLRLLIRYGPEF